MRGCDWRSTHFVEGAWATPRPAHMEAVNSNETALTSCGLAPRQGPCQQISGLKCRFPALDSSGDLFCRAKSWGRSPETSRTRALERNSRFLKRRAELSPRFLFPIPPHPTRERELENGRRANSAAIGVNRVADRISHTRVRVKLRGTGRGPDFRGPGRRLRLLPRPRSRNTLGLASVSQSDASTCSG